MAKLLITLLSNIFYRTLCPRTALPLNIRVPVLEKVASFNWCQNILFS